MVLTEEQIARALALVEDGRSQRYAARSLNVAESTLRDALRRHRETGLLSRRPGSGRHRVTNRRDDRFVQLYTLRNRGVNAVQATQRLRAVRGVDVSAQTVRRRLAEYGLTPYRPAQGPMLTANHKRERLTFAQEHADWGEVEWSNVLFTDESRFALYVSDGRQRVYRRRGERFAPCNFATNVQFGGGSVMVWGGISMDAKTDLHVFGRGSMNAESYIRDILDMHVVPYAPFIGDNFILMQDNARPHVANVVREYMDITGIRTMDWPARSPDLNPIEHIWDELGRSVRNGPNPPETLDELRNGLVQAWNDMDQNVVKNLIISMPARMQAVIGARGGNTRY